MIDHKIQEHTRGLIDTLHGHLAKVELFADRLFGGSFADQTDPEFWRSAMAVIDDALTSVNNLGTVIQNLQQKVASQPPASATEAQLTQLKAGIDAAVTALTNLESSLH